MWRGPRSAAFGLIVLLAAAACSAPAGPGWVEGTGRGTSTTAATSNESTGPSAGPTTASSSTTATTSTTPTPDSDGSTGGDADTGWVHCLPGSDARCEDNSAAGSAYLSARVTGGIYGFRFVRLGAGVIASLNPEHAFYPASSIKVLAHLHAVRWAAAQPDPTLALTTPIPVYDDFCAGEGTYRAEPLAEVLAAMMIDSDNRRADAIVDFFGREAINATARAVAGTSDTLVAHRLGCGGPANDPANRSTALDLSRIYEGITRPDVLGPEALAMFTSLMLGPVWPSFESAVAGEAEALGLDRQTVEAFRAGVRLSYKAGWWGTNLSVGGLLTLPPGPCPGDQPRRYAFAVFVDGADEVADGFDVTDVVAVVLRDEIGAALLEWADLSCAP